MSQHQGRHFLGIYLSDHHAGATAALELARRCAARNADNPLGAYLRDTFIPEVVDDRTTLEGIMARVGASPAPLKDALAWFGEKLERLKPNGEFTGYSPLSRLIEVETLTLGVRGKRAGWHALEAVASSVRELSDVDLARLLARADAQETALESLRRDAARGAFA